MYSFDAHSAYDLASLRVAFHLQKGFPMATNVAALLRQIKLYEDSKYLSDHQKTTAIAQCRREIDEALGQGHLPLQDASIGAVQAPNAPSARTPK